MGLMYSWDYIPDMVSLAEYRMCIQKKLGEEYCRLLDSSIECNQYSLYRRGRLEVKPMQIMTLLEEQLELSKRLCIYGCGNIGHAIEKWLIRNYNVKPVFITTESLKNGESSIDVDDLVIIGVSEKHQLDVMNNVLRSGGTRTKVFPYNLIGMREFLHIVEYDNWTHDVGGMYISLNEYEKTITKAHVEN